MPLLYDKDMKTKVRIILLAVSVVLFISSACSRKINGATPHRRDRNCGCENVTTPGDTSAATCTIAAPEQPKENQI